MLDLIWLIPALPLVGFLVLVVVGRRLGEPLAGWLATAMVGASFVVTVGVFLALLGEPEEERAATVELFTWLPAGSLEVSFGFLADPLSITMALFVTGISALIHLYSIGYMHGDANYSKFFVYLNLFVFSMLCLVLGDNLLMTFLGWEGVGTCSYLLISFWFGNEANASAGKKAFVTNRIGDFGFMLAMFVAFGALGTLQYVTEDGGGILQRAGELAPVTATAVAGLLFVGAIGKSAQFPLYVWLPDAMAGPTPVSALIHAATMVTSGIYLLTRVNPLIAESFDWLPTTIAWVGAGTALFAATIALAQHDIKKVLAYSTISQLGYMFLAVGVGAYVPAVFHMVTHAFFKALLFLGAGSVIHGVHEEQDMRRMGGLRTLMPITAVTFIIGWLAIAGIPPFAGFWSKDEILLYAFAENPVLWAIGGITALLTAYYMSRQVFLVFFGPPRFALAGGGTADDHGASPTAAVRAGAESEAATTGPVATTGHAPDHRPVHVHESPWPMTVPLLALAGLSIVGGALQLPFSSDLHFLEEWLHPVIGLAENEAHIDVATGTKVLLAVLAVIAGLLGIAFAARVFLQRRARAVEPALLEQAWHYDAAISAFVAGPGRAGFEGAGAFDRRIVDGAVNGTATVVRVVADRLRLAQSGYVRSYALGVAVGAVVLVGLFLSRASL